MTEIAHRATPSGQSGQGAQARGGRTALRAAWVWGQRALLAAALALFLGIGLLPRLGLYRPVTVLSSSMKPTFSPGDMIVDVPEPVGAVRVGQVISYRVPVGERWVESHRIVRILHGGAHPVVQTKGDANNGVDPWTAKLEGHTAWRQVAVIPKLGYLINALRGRTLRIAALLVAPMMLALLALGEIWGVGAGRARRERQTSAPAPSGGALER